MKKDPLWSRVGTQEVKTAAFFEGLSFKGL